MSTEYKLKSFPSVYILSSKAQMSNHESCAHLNYEILLPAFAVGLMIITGTDILVKILLYLLSYAVLKE